MAAPLVKTATIDGRAFSIYVNEDGMFYAQVGPQSGDDVLKAPTLPELEKKLAAVVRQEKRRLAIPITVMVRNPMASGPRAKDIGLRAAVLTGIHTSNGNPLLRFEDDGSKGQLDDYHQTVMRRLSVDEQTQVVAAHLQRLNANMAWEELIDQFKVRAKDLVAEALGDK